MLRKPSMRHRKPPYKVALAQQQNRESALETARVRLSYTRIKATWEKGTGTRYVGERFVHEGAMLSTNTPTLSIIELQPITAVIHVTDKDYFRLALEQKVDMPPIFWTTFSTHFCDISEGYKALLF